MSQVQQGNSSHCCYQAIKARRRRYGSHTRVWLLLVCVVCALIFGCGKMPGAQKQPTSATSTLPAQFIASIDTMKESRDTETNQLTKAQIADDVNLCAILNPNYITVDGFYNDPAYIARWVIAIRVTGKHVWFRLALGSKFSPSDALRTIHDFIVSHPGLVRHGDIFDPDAEPENHDYWSNRYGPNWSWQPTAPNAATYEFNAYLVSLGEVTDQAFQQVGITGVATNVHSMSSWWYLHPEALYQSTVDRWGVIAVDSYPDSTATDPTTAANVRVQELQQIEAMRHLPILVAELGYSIALQVDDTTQARVLKEEFAALSTLPYVVGVNYWVGPGLDVNHDYSRIFTGSRGFWSLRPAAFIVKQFFASKGPVSYALSIA